MMPIEQCSSRIANALEENKRLRKSVEDWHDIAVRSQREIDRLRAEVVELKKALGEAIEWNWLDDDRPAHLFRKYLEMSALRGEGE